MHYGTYHFDFSMYTGVILHSSSLAIKYTNIIPLKNNFKSPELLDDISGRSTLSLILKNSGNHKLLTRLRIVCQLQHS